MNFYKYDLMDALHARYFESCAVTFDVADYVRDEYLISVEKFIFKALKKDWKKINKEVKKHQKQLKRLNKLNNTDEETIHDQEQTPEEKMHIGSAEECYHTKLCNTQRGEEPESTSCAASPCQRSEPTSCVDTIEKGTSEEVPVLGAAEDKQT